MSAAMTPPRSDEGCLDFIATPENPVLAVMIASVANDLEHIADVIASDMVTSTRKRMEEHAEISSYTAERLTEYHTKVAQAPEGAVQSVLTEDLEMATAVRNMKHDLVEMSRYISRTRFERLKSADSGIGRYVREVELLELLDGIFKTARRIARSRIERVGPAAAPTA